MQPQNANVVTGSSNFSWLGAKLLLPQNPSKLLLFLPSRSDGNIATMRSSTLVLIKQQNRSIQAIFSRGWCASRWCVYVLVGGVCNWCIELIRLIKDTDRAHFPSFKSIDWTLAPEQLGNCPGPARGALKHSGLLGMGVPEFTMF